MKKQIYPTFVSLTEITSAAPPLLPSATFVFISSRLDASTSSAPSSSNDSKTEGRVEALLANAPVGRSEDLTFSREKSNGSESEEFYMFLGRRIG